MTDKDLDELRRARKLLENPGLAARLSNMAGTPIETALLRLPEPMRDSVQAATRRALEGSLGSALKTLGHAPAGQPSRDRLHKACAVAAGGVGGFFGGVGLLVELPLTTTIMLRSIADIARGNGEDLSRPEARLACLEVFALGGTGAEDDGAETGYFAVRAALSRTVSDATRYLTSGAGDAAAPVLVRLLTAIAKRFGLSVSQKLAAQLVPVVGALGGAAINSVFMAHFQGMARGHFIVRRLERVYGKKTVRCAWGELA